jgi:hypothetical protein
MSESSRRPRFVKILVGLATATGAFVALAGFAHTPTGRPLLGLLARAGGCPVPMGDGVKATPAERDAYRAKQLLAVRGEVPAKARFAGGFVLDGTTRAEAKTAVEGHGATCKAGLSGSLTCVGVPAAALVGYQGTSADDVTFAFDASDKLVGVDVTRFTVDADEASKAYGSLNRQLQETAGPKASEAGTGSSTYLVGGALRQARTDYRFSDYVAYVSATNMGSKFAIRESYRSATPQRTALR